jgi:hypothetical protein
MTVFKKYKINEFITLKLEEDLEKEGFPKITNIYIDGKKFLKCKHLLFIDPLKNDKHWKIRSIDEAQEELNKSDVREFGEKELHISPEQEFWGHCSNLQAWVENKYDTKLLHSNLAFPLLKQLTEIGDPLAKRKFKEEIAKRFQFGTDKVRQCTYQLKIT